MKNSLKKIFKHIMADMIKQTIPNEIKHYRLEYLNIEVDGSQLQKKEFVNLVKLRLKSDKKEKRRKLNKKFNKLAKKSCINLHDFMY